MAFSKGDSEPEDPQMFDFEDLPDHVGIVDQHCGRETVRCLERYLECELAKLPSETLRDLPGFEDREAVLSLTVEDSPED